MGIPQIGKTQAPLSYLQTLVCQHMSVSGFPQKYEDFWLYAYYVFSRIAYVKYVFTRKGATKDTRQCHGIAIAMATD